MRYGLLPKKFVNLIQRLAIVALLLLLCSNLVQFFISVNYRPKGQIPDHVQEFEDSLFVRGKRLNRMEKAAPPFFSPKSGLKTSDPTFEEAKLRSKLEERIAEKKKRDIMALMRKKAFAFPAELWSNMSQNNSNPIVLARVLGNDLPPLHSTNQTFINTKTVLEKEAIPSNCKRLWIINSLADKEKVTALVDLFTLYNESYRVITTDYSKPETIVANGLNVNRGRNLALKAGFLEMNASWVFLFDGAAFLSAEGLLPLLKFSIENPSKPSYHFTAVYRLLYKIDLNSSIKIENILEYTTGQQETMLGMNREAYYDRMRSKVPRSALPFFDEKRSYGKADKFHTLAQLKSKTNSHCREILIGVDQQKKTALSEQKTVQKCGYMLRMVYYPDDNYPFDQREYFRLKGVNRVEAVDNFYKRFNVTQPKPVPARRWRG